MQDVVVFKSPDPTKFKLANAAFPGTPTRLTNIGELERARSRSTSKSNADASARAKLAAVEPASTTPSPASVAPLVLLMGSQFGIPGTTPKLASQGHSTPPGLVEAGWDSEVSAEA